MTKNHCIEQVTGFTGLHRMPCRNPKKHGDYCGIHSPERKAARRAKRGPSRWERECAARKRYDEALDTVLATARMAACVWRLNSLQEALDAFDDMTDGGKRRRPIVG